MQKGPLPNLKGSGSLLDDCVQVEKTLYSVQKGTARSPCKDGFPASSFKTLFPSLLLFVTGYRILAVGHLGRVAGQRRCLDKVSGKEGTSSLGQARAQAMAGDNEHTVIIISMLWISKYMNAGKHLTREPTRGQHCLSEWGVPRWAVLKQRLR